MRCITWVIVEKESKKIVFKTPSLQKRDEEFNKYDADKFGTGCYWWNV